MTEESSSSSHAQQFGDDLIMSLPPMDESDLNVITNGLKQLNACSEDGLKNRSARECCTARSGDDAAAHGSSDSSSLAGSIQFHIEQYQQQQYKERGVTSRCAVAADDGTTGALRIRTYAERLDGQNWSAGSWSAEWIAKNCGNQKSEATLSGTVRVHAHNFEDSSNVQMRVDRTFAETSVECSSTEEDSSSNSLNSLGKACVHQITSWEEEVFQDINARFQNGDVESNLKTIRRILPITKTRMKWDVAASQQITALNARRPATTDQR